MTTVYKSDTRFTEFDPIRLKEFINEMAKGLNIPEESLDSLSDKITQGVVILEKITVNSLSDRIIRECTDRLSIEAPYWDKLAARIAMNRLYKAASKSRMYQSDQKYDSFVPLIETLVDNNVYSPDLLQSYSTEELLEAEKMIVPSRDDLFDYKGLNILSSRYLAKIYGEKNSVYELPQERFMIIALYLMQKEDPSKRMYYVSEAYYALSNLQMTVATPTLANSGKVYAQLSSCFIDTVDDSIMGIFNSNTDIARVSQSGGGVGVYMGNVRSAGSSVRGVPNASGGVVPWIRQINNTAISVDQVGARKGAVAVYLDVFHPDIEKFLDLRLNNGDQRLRAHDIFTGVCIPDLFMKAVERRGEWHLFDPYEVQKAKGWKLNDFFGKEFEDKYEELVEGNLYRRTVKAIDVMKRIMISQIETGTPFTFYRDTVNAANPNKHAGNIYCTNLCTEILQNQSPTIVVEEVLQDEKGVSYITQKREAGDFVVCNLSSINLGRAVQKDFRISDVLPRLIKIQVRMLDNVIDLNHLPIPQATSTNQKYRAIGLGTFGWHHLLAKMGIHWDSDRAVDLADRLWEDINFLTIEASHELAVEKGAYPIFKGSEWETGRYFERRDYEDDRWTELKEKVMEDGVRNAYMMAVAPNMSTAQIAGSTASIDPIYDVMYYEEKKDYRLPVIAPDISLDTFEYYEKGAFRLDQTASVRQNIARQRHVDQAISFNFYIPTDIKASKLLDLHMMNWKGGVKCTYYVRSDDIKVEECEWCSS